MSSCSSDHLVYLGVGEVVLRAGFVEVYEIYAYPPIPVVFLYDDRV